MQQLTGIQTINNHGLRVLSNKCNKMNTTSRSAKSLAGYDSLYRLQKEFWWGSLKLGIVKESSLMTVRWTATGKSKLILYFQ